MLVTPTLINSVYHGRCMGAGGGRRLTPYPSWPSLPPVFFPAHMMHQMHSSGLDACLMYAPMPDPKFSPPLIAPAGNSGVAHGVYIKPIKIYNDSEQNRII